MNYPRVQGQSCGSTSRLVIHASIAHDVLERVDEEVFGPVLSAMTWSTEDEAADLANAGRYGLTAAIWTQDIDKALRMADRIEAGYLWVNDVETRFPAVPFGGWGDSGVGVEHGLEEILSFTRIKAVNVRVR